MSEPLKHCPFCGKKPRVERGGPGNLVWYIVCEEGSHSILLSGNERRKDVVAAWNDALKEQS